MRNASCSAVSRPLLDFSSTQSVNRSSRPADRAMIKMSGNPRLTPRRFIRAPAMAPRPAESIEVHQASGGSARSRYCATAICRTCSDWKACAGRTGWRCTTAPRGSALAVRPALGAGLRRRFMAGYHPGASHNDAQCGGGGIATLLRRAWNNPHGGRGCPLSRHTESMADVPIYPRGFRLAEASVPFAAQDSSGRIAHCSDAGRLCQRAARRSFFLAARPSQD